MESIECSGEPPSEIRKQYFITTESCSNGRTFNRDATEVLVPLTGILITRPDLATLCSYSTRNVQTVFTKCRSTTPAKVFNLLCGIYVPETGTAGIGFTLYLVTDVLDVLKIRSKNHAYAFMRDRLQNSYNILYNMHKNSSVTYQKLIGSRLFK